MLLNILRVWLLVVGFGMFARSAFTQDTAVVDQFLKAIENQVYSIGSMECEIDCYERGSLKPNASLRWQENAASYAFTFEEFNADGESHFWSSASSGENGSMYALERGRFLFVEKAKKSIPLEVRNFPLPLCMFDFVFSSHSEDPWQQPSIALLNSPATLLSLADRVKLLGCSEREGVSEATFEVTGGVDKFLGIPVVYHATTLRQGAPLVTGLSVHDLSGRKLSEFRVEKFQEVKVGDKTVRLPKTVQARYFAVDKDHISAKPTNWITVVYKNLVVNTMTNGDYTLDVSSAELVRDVDSKTTIEVPK